MNTVAINKIKDYIKTLTGLEVTFPKSLQTKEGELIDAVDILPSQCGAIAPIFKSIQLLITVKYFDFTIDGGNKGYKIFLCYRYKHPAGSNGYEVSYITIDDCETFQPYN